MIFTCRTKRFHEALEDVAWDLYAERHPSSYSADVYGPLLVSMLLRIIGEPVAELLEDGDGNFTLRLTTRIGHATEIGRAHV